MHSRFRSLGSSRRPSRLAAALVGASVAIGGASAQAADAGLSGCGRIVPEPGLLDCPPANANLNALSGCPDVLALSFFVTYWDRLGWKDTFGKAEFTDRQWRYARAMRHDNVSTPQVVVNGQIDGVGADPGEIEASDEPGGARREPPEVASPDDRPRSAPLRRPHEPADVWLVRYDPRTLEVAVRRGENAGKTLPHKNIVRDIVRAGRLERQSRAVQPPCRQFRPERSHSRPDRRRGRFSPPRNNEREACTHFSSLACLACRGTAPPVRGDRRRNLPTRPHSGAASALKGRRVP